MKRNLTLLLLVVCILINGYILMFRSPKREDYYDTCYGNNKCPTNQCCSLEGNCGGNYEEQKNKNSGDGKYCTWIWHDKQGNRVPGWRGYKYENDGI